MSRPRPGRIFPALAAVALVVLLVGLVVPVGANAGGYPILPLPDDRGFLGNLSAPSLAPAACPVRSRSRSVTPSPGK